MYANVYEMKMPTNYVDMNTSELEYTGGWDWWKTVCAISTIVGGVGTVGTGCTVAVTTGWSGVGCVVGGSVAAVGAGFVIQGFQDLIDSFF